MTTDNAQSMTQLRSGERIGDRYHIVRHFAEGGMASIYLGHDPQTNSPVAIKQLYGYYANNKIIRARFLDEGRIQKMLKHPNIVRVFEVLEDPVLAIVMEYIPGQTLEEYLSESGPLSEIEIIEIIIPVLSALGLAHNMGIIHRDLKPSNILLHRHGGLVHPKVMDFGVAKISRARELTATGTTVGTLHYMSPEQVVGSRQIDGRADIYSLGITLYKLATAELPFEAATEFALMMAQVESRPLPPSELREDLSAELEAIILRAILKKPEERYQNIKEMTQALMALHSRIEGAVGNATRPIPQELIRVAMLADQIAEDRTGEFNLASATLEDIDELRGDLGDATVPGETRNAFYPKEHAQTVEAPRTVPSAPIMGESTTSSGTPLRELRRTPHRPHRPYQHTPPTRQQRVYTGRTVDSAEAITKTSTIEPLQTFDFTDADDRTVRDAPLPRSLWSDDDWSDNEPADDETVEQPPPTWTEPSLDNELSTDPDSQEWVTRQTPRLPNYPPSSDPSPTEPRIQSKRPQIYLHPDDPTPVFNPNSVALTTPEELSPPDHNEDPPRFATVAPDPMEETTAAESTQSDVDLGGEWSNLVEHHEIPQPSPSPPASTAPPRHREANSYASSLSTQPANPHAQIPASDDRLPKPQQNSRSTPRAVSTKLVVGVAGLLVAAIVVLVVILLLR